VNSITLDGNSSPSLASGSAGIYTTSTDQFSVSGGPPAAPTPTPTPVVTQGGTFGSGADTLTVDLAEDAYQGDAQANVAIDGTLLTPTPLTVTASHAAGGTEAFNFEGYFGSGQHTVAISFLNDAYGGSPSLDRNLYVNGLTLDGNSSPSLASGATTMPWTATDQFSVSGGTPAAPSPTPTPVVTQGGTFGSGADTLILTLAEDAYQGDAQANVSIDGTLLTATPLTVTASHAAGASEAFTFQGYFGSGQHTVAVSFLNDAYGGSPSLDRNLYVNSITLDGNSSPSLASGSAGIYTTSTDQFSVSGGTPAPVGAAQGQDTLALYVSEDAWQGNAQFTIQVDGKTIGGPQTAFASHAAGQSQAYVVQGDFGAGPHQVGVTFLNDAWGGSPSTDRNLYLDGVDFDGNSFLNGTIAQYWDGSTSPVQVSAAAAGYGPQHPIQSMSPAIMLPLS
ncbi:MAG: hypothetical protein JO157_10685, partial [Acetobacteraceae bacterium]|nr:hypothetical protein [Acetobacteraceae bacterium]